ncbi:retrovirus-related pol polyprotein from transposon RE2 [Tanacetum coccineum]
MISAMTSITTSYILVRLPINREAITEVILYSASPPSPPYDFSDHHRSLDANASKSSATQSTTIEVDVSYSQKMTTILLNEFNYLPWSRAITIALSGRSCLGFISGKNANPEIFSYSESSKDLWEAVRDMYGNQNNTTPIFQIQLDIANLRQDINSFVNLLGKLKGLWNEMEVYRPHSVDPKILRKRHKDDQVFQLLASLGPDFKELKRHILLNAELPTLKSVCATIQREEIHRKVMINDATTPEARVYSANASLDKKPYKGKRSDQKCGHCNVHGHSMDRCWILHPELKPKFTKDKKGYIDKRRVTNLKARMATHTTNQGILLAFISALEFSNLHDFWIVDSGATDHISNKLTNVSDFIPFPNPSFVSVANGKGARVLGKGKINLVSKSVESDVLYVPSFPFQLLSVKKLTSSLNCQALFTPSKVIFQDPVTKRMIGEGFLINGLYYFFPDHKISQGFQAYISPNNEHILWHCRVGHPSESTF